MRQPLIVCFKNKMWDDSDNMRKKTKSKKSPSIHAPQSNKVSNPAKKMLFGVTPLNKKTMSHPKNI